MPLPSISFATFLLLLLGTFFLVLGASLVLGVLFLVLWGTFVVWTVYIDVELRRVVAAIAVAVVVAVFAHLVLS